MSGSTNNFPPVPTRGYRRLGEGNTNNFPPVPTRVNRRLGEGYDAGASNANDYFRAGQNNRGQVPWLSRFPEPPISPFPFQVDEIERNFIHPRPSPQYIPESLPRIAAQMRSLQLAQEEESRLSRDEQNKALNKLKKEVYNPTPKRLAKRLSTYYRDSADATTRNSRFNEKGDEEYEEKCAICLDDFEPKQLIVRTPCNHMFHEDCIVPWIKSHGQCPVCRSAICERMRENLVPPNNITAAHVPVDLLIELLRWDI